MNETPRALTVARAALWAQVLLGGWTAGNGVYVAWFDDSVEGFEGAGGLLIAVLFTPFTILLAIVTLRLKRGAFDMHNLALVLQFLFGLLSGLFAVGGVVALFSGRGLASVWWILPVIAPVTGFTALLRSSSRNYCRTPVR